MVQSGGETQLNTSVFDLAAVNSLDIEAFSARLGGIFEHSPWVARAAYAVRPFPSIAVLHATMVSVVAHSGPDRQLALLRAHPELARPASLTAASASEQGGMGLDRLNAEEAALFDARNAAYREKFGFPFIIAVRGQKDRAAILAAMTARLDHTAEEEIAAALAEVAKIARFRLDDLIVADKAPGPAAGRLTVHVLDTAEGKPAAGLQLKLYRLADGTRIRLGIWRTNADGRCEAPLLSGAALLAGTYEVVFDILGWRGVPDVGFYDLIPIRFRVTDPAAHYHIPLLLSPFGYSTYRGS